MSTPFTDEEVRILKKICENPIFKKSKPLHIKKISDLKRIKLDICNHYDISENDFLSNRRSAYLIQARKDFVHHASKLNRCTTGQIARAMGKNHATVYHYLKIPSPSMDELLQHSNDENG